MVLIVMQTVLWPDSRWKEIGLGDLLEPRQVSCNLHGLHGTLLFCFVFCFFFLLFCSFGTNFIEANVLINLIIMCRIIQVKLQYRKAMLVVHPDHNVKLSNENKYISKRIFEAVNEAYNEFTTKETV